MCEAAGMERVPLRLLQEPQISACATGEGGVGVPKRSRTRSDGRAIFLDHFVPKRRPTSLPCVNCYHRCDIDLKVDAYQCALMVTCAVAYRMRGANN
jgi:hypothetical protein